jgi:hypothetical protein
VNLRLDTKRVVSETGHPSPAHPRRSFLAAGSALAVAALGAGRAFRKVAGPGKLRSIQGLGMGHAPPE